MKQTVIDGRGAVQTVTSWKYEGKRLVAIEHPNQAERYRHDEQGHLAAKTVILKLASGAQASSITRYGYDALGQLQSTSLPDGSTIEFKRNGQNQVVGLERSQIQTSWLKWLLPAKTIVRDLERDIVGLKRFTYGNGIQASYQRSTDGILARIVYRHPDAGIGAGQQSTAVDAILGIIAAHAAQGKADSRAQPALPGALGLAQDKNALIDHRYLWDVQGNLLHAQGKDMQNNYAYDVQDRLIIAGSARSSGKPENASQASYSRYFHDGAGNRVLAQEDIADQADTRTHTVKAKYSASSNRWEGITDGAPQARYDASGQPTHISQREYAWDAMGRLIEVRQENRSLATYSYNNNGERVSKTTGGHTTGYLYEGRKLVAELNGQGKITRQTIYLAGQAIAVIDTPQGSPLDSVERSPLAQIAADIATAFKAWFSSNEAIAYLHNNHLGATELVTDAKGQPIWQAAYSPYGKIVQASANVAVGQGKSGFKLNLRLPGQYEDAERTRMAVHTAKRSTSDSWACGIPC